MSGGDRFYSPIFLSFALDFIRAHPDDIHVKLPPLDRLLRVLVYDRDHQPRYLTGVQPFYVRCRSQVAGRTLDMGGRGQYGLSAPRYGRNGRDRSCPTRHRPF